MALWLVVVVVVAVAFWYSGTLLDFVIDAMCAKSGSSNLLLQNDAPL